MRAARWMKASARHVRTPDLPRPAFAGRVAKRTWLPDGKRCAIIFTVDDVHPARSTDAYEAGGDLERGALGHVAWLLERHRELHVTLFVTPDWRQISPFATRTLLARLPVLGSRLPLAPMLRKGTMSIERHPEFVRYLRSLPRTDFALHGLHHVSVGPRVGVEFQTQSRDECAAMLREGVAICRRAGLPLRYGQQPPRWHLTAALAAASVDVGLRWVCAARDLTTAPTDDAEPAMNGPRGVSMIHPTLLEQGRLVHLSTNFQATTDVERAFAILDRGGVLSIKAHVVKRAGAYVALDALDEAYRSYLDAVLRLAIQRYGDSIWFTSPDAIAERVRHADAHTEVRHGDDPRAG